MIHSVWVELNPMNREDIAALLSKAGSNLTVKSLLDNLQLTVEFESTMTKKWATTVSLAYHLLLKMARRVTTSSKT